MVDADEAAHLSGSLTEGHSNDEQTPIMNIFNFKVGILAFLAKRLYLCIANTKEIW